MRISFRLDHLDSHAHFAVFIDGGLAGNLCVTFEKWHDLRMLTEHGARGCGHAFTISDAREKQDKEKSA